MSVQVSCDRCKGRIGDVAWLLAATPAEAPDMGRALTGVHHLHWDCVPAWGRENPLSGAARLRAEFDRLQAQYGRRGGVAITQDHLNGFEAACEILEAGT